MLASSNLQYHDGCRVFIHHFQIPPLCEQHHCHHLSTKPPNKRHAGHCTIHLMTNKKPSTIHYSHWCTLKEMGSTVALLSSHFLPQTASPQREHCWIHKRRHSIPALISSRFLSLFVRQQDRATAELQHGVKEEQQKETLFFTTVKKLKTCY